MRRNKAGTKGQPAPRQRHKFRRAMVAALIVSAMASGVVGARWGSLRHHLWLSPPAGSAVQSQPDLRLSKEYIYAGGRLIATEEPSAINGAAFVSQDVPTAMTAGQLYNVSVTMRNSGTSTWQPSTHRLGSQNPQDNTTWSLGRVDVPATVAPGASYTFRFTVRAPTSPGAYDFQWRMLQEGVEWFGDPAANASINVAFTVSPTNLVATGKPGLSGTQIDLSWQAPASSGTVDHYEIERKGAQSTDVLKTADATTIFTDSVSPPSVAAYRYRVMAVFVGGGVSGYSNPDLATTAVFADDPLNPNGTRTTIRALHFAQLRDAVNAVRVTAGLPPFDWANPAPQSGGEIRASHYNDLRANLAEALSRLGLPGPQSAPAAVGGYVTYIPVQELRNLIR